MSQREEQEEVEKLLAEAGWQRVNKQWQKSARLADADELPS